MFLTLVKTDGFISFQVSYHGVSHPNIDCGVFTGIQSRDYCLSVVLSLIFYKYPG